jgi:hypothetical protein
MEERTGGERRMSKIIHGSVDGSDNIIFRTIQTNGDRLRAGTDDLMAVEMACIAVDFIFGKNLPGSQLIKLGLMEKIGDWLQAPAEEAREHDEG